MSCIYFYSFIYVPLITPTDVPIAVASFCKSFVNVPYLFFKYSPRNTLIPILGLSNAVLIYLDKSGGEYGLFLFKNQE